MGFDCTYQGIPEDSVIIKKAFDDAEFAENVFYSVVAFANCLQGEGYFKEPEFTAARSLFSEYPEVETWNYNPSSRMHDALIYILNPDSYISSKGYTELEKTLPFRIVKGEQVFSDHLRATQGVPVRVSSFEFVEKCFEFCNSYSIDELKSNFDARKMTELGLYKVGESSEYKFIEDYFLGLTNFYRDMVSVGQVSVFVSED